MMLKDLAQSYLFYISCCFAPVRAHLRVDDQLMCQREPLQSSKQSLAAAEVFNNPVPVLITIVVLGWRFVR